MDTQSLLLQKEFKNSFWFSFLQSLLLVFLSELSGSNFVHIQIINLKTNSTVVFISSIIALLSVHALSFLTGCTLAFILQENPVEILCILLLFFSGMIIAYKAFQMTSKTIEDEMILKLKEEIQEIIEEDQTIRQEEYQAKLNKALTNQLTIIDECLSEETMRHAEELREPLIMESKASKLIPLQTVERKLDKVERVEYKQKFSSRKESQNWSYNDIKKIFRDLFLNEIGKAAQLGIIAIASACNKSGLLLGAVLGIILVVMLACCFGGVICKYVTTRTIKFIAAFSFLAIGTEVIFAKEIF